jgi:hypothetical protein
MLERVRHLDQGGFRVFLGMLLCFAFTSLWIALTQGESFRYSILDHVFAATIVFCGIPFAAFTPTDWLGRVLFVLLSVIANILIALIWGVFFSCFGFGNCP